MEKVPGSKRRFFQLSSSPTLRLTQRVIANFQAVFLPDLDRSTTLEDSTLRAFDRFQDRLQSDKSGKTQPDKAQHDKSQLPKSQPNPRQSSFSPLEQSTVGSRLDSGFQNPV